MSPLLPLLPLVKTHKNLSTTTNLDAASATNKAARHHCHVTDCCPSNASASASAVVYRCQRHHCQHLLSTKAAVINTTIYATVNSAINTTPSIPLDSSGRLSLLVVAALGLSAVDGFPCPPCPSVQIGSHPHPCKT